MKNAVIISCFGWYERRLFHLCNRLRESGYSVNVYLSDYSHVTKSVISERIDGVHYISVPRYKKNLSIKRIYSHWFFANECYKHINSIKPCIVYVLAPPNMCAYFAAKYKESNKNVKLIIDLIDMWPESFPMGLFKKTPIYRIWQHLRTKGILISDALVSECDYYLEVLDNSCAKRYPLKLFKDISNDEKETIYQMVASHSSGIRKGKLNLCYLGSINNIIDLQSIKNILFALKDHFEVTIHIIGDVSSKKSLIDIINSAGCELQDYGRVFDEEIKRSILTKCDYGLNLMVTNVQVGLTLKSIDYFAYGLPIINNIKGDTWNLVQNESVGVNYTGDDKVLVDFVENNRIEQYKLNVLTCFETHFSKQSFEKCFDLIINDLGLIN